MPCGGDDDACAPGAWATSDLVSARALRAFRAAALVYTLATWLAACAEHPLARLPTQASYWALALATLYFGVSLVAARPAAPPRTCRLAAALQHVVAASAATITLLFWAFVFPGDAHARVGATTLLLHGGLAAVAACELVLARLPYLFVDLAWTLAFALAYALFTLVHWTATRGLATPSDGARPYVFLDLGAPRAPSLIVALVALTVLADAAMMGVAAGARAFARARGAPAVARL